ncbi:ATP synthase F1 subunit gamma [Candidatus Cardinium hertigii]|uniref:ATP synthase F1 subunit gamma n=1 Tax=Candidatus Cardinium hertigii TaxID=247481 RepID=UPI003D7E6D47
MAHLKEVVDRINLIAFTQQITKAMKMVSASKLHKIQQVLLPLKAYTRQHDALLHAALQNMDKTDPVHPLSQKKIEQRLLLIVVASNRGLCGAFNKNVLSAAYAHIKRRQQASPIAVEVLPIGKKAHQFFKKSNLPIIEDYVDLLAKPNDQASAKLTTYCIEAFQQNSYSEVVLVYTAFKNSGKQGVTVLPFLPFLPDIEATYTPPPLQTHHYIYEPSQALFIAQLMPEVLKHKIIHMLIESSASEHAARMVTMSQATDNADDLLKTLRISYNRSRQALITSALAEITSGAEALAEA